MLLQQHKPKPSNVRVRAGTLVASALKRSLCECRPSNSWFLSGSSQLGQRQQLVNRAQRLPSALSRSPECAIERTHARAAKPQPITHEPTALAAMPRAPPGGKPRPPPTRPKMQSVGEDDSDEESFAFVVPSRHGSPRQPRTSAASAPKRWRPEPGRQMQTSLSRACYSVSEREAASVGELVCQWTLAMK